MKSQATCPRCGAAHPAAMIGGLCPRCLVGGLLWEGEEARLPQGEGAGDAVGPYELVELLGEGGMGSVWRARQLHPVEREVALKIIRLGMDTREIVSRFEAERQSLAMMDHPGIARVYEAGATESGRPYFAMELVAGEPVTDYCVSRSLSVEGRLKIFLEICGAVEHAHRKGVLHRDLKPSNVLVVEGAGGPRVKVIDFGIAKLLDEEIDGRTFATRAGHAIGTPGYMSPEQAGAAPDVDTRSDVYSLGALLYEMLTGAPPLGRETFREVAHAEVMRLIRETDPPRPSTRAGTVGELAPPLRIARDLDRIVMKALSRERERRYGGATLLGEDVRRFLDHEPVSATDPTLGYRAGKFVRKHRVPVGFSVLLVVALMVATLLVAREAGRARQAARQAELAAGREMAARREVQAALADSYRDHGLAKSGELRYAEAALWFELAADAVPDDPERVAANRLRAALHGDIAAVPVRFLEQGSAPGSELRFDPTSRYFLETCRSTSPLVFDLESARRLSFDPPLVAAAFLPDRAWLVSATGGETVEIYDLDAGAVAEAFEVPGEAVGAVAVSADGDRVFAGGSRPRVWSRRSGGFVSGPMVHPVPVRAAVFSADGTQVLTWDEDRRLRVLPVAEGEPQSNFEPIATDEDAVRPDDPHLTSRWESHGQLLVKIDNRMEAIDAASGERSAPFPEIGLGFDTDLSADGSLVATPGGVQRPGSDDFRFRRRAGWLRFAADDSVVLASELGEWIDLDGVTTGFVPLGAGDDSAFSPDGTLLAVREEPGIRIHRLVFPEPFLRVRAPEAGLIALSPDETVISHAGHERPGEGGQVTRAYRLEDGVAAGPLIDTGFPLRSAAFLRGDRKRLLTGSRAVAEESVLQLWDVSSGERLAGPLRLPSEARAMAQHPSDAWVAVLCEDGSILRVEPMLEAFEIIDPSVPETATGEPVVSAGLAFSEDGSTLFANGARARIRAIDSRSGEPRFPGTEQDRPGLRLQVRGGRILSISGDDEAAWLFDVDSGRPSAVAAGCPRPTMARGSELSADGSELLLAGRNRVSVIDWRSGAEIGPGLETGRDAWGFSRFVPGTPWILSVFHPTSRAQVLCLWDRRTGAPLGPRWRLAGKQRSSDMVVTADGRHAVVSLVDQGYVIVKLDELRARAAFTPEASGVDAVKLAALLAGRRIEGGRPVSYDTMGDWASAWQAATELRRDPPALRPSREVLLRWHRNREAFLGPDTTGGRWHRARIEALEDFSGNLPED